MHTVYIGIGTNEGNRFENISKAIKLIREKVGESISISSIYENPPIGFESDLQFYNLCISISTELTPTDVLIQLKEIESKIGRKLKSNNGVYSSRCIDLDILFYDNLIYTSDLLTIPHVNFKKRRFVLEPLFEIESNLIDPVSGHSIAVLLNNCDDNSKLDVVCHASDME